MTALPDFRLESHFSQWEFAARFNLTASDAETLSLAELLALASPEDRAGFEDMSLGYTQTFGAPDLRAAIASTYERRAAEDILCFAGAEEGLYAAMQVLLGPGDHAIVVTPNYQAAETVPLVALRRQRRAAGAGRQLVAGYRQGRGGDPAGDQTGLDQFSPQSRRERFWNARASTRWSIFAAVMASGCSATKSIVLSARKARCICRKWRMSMSAAYRWA